MSSLGEERVVRGPFSAMAVLFDPIGATGRAVQAGRFVIALALAMVLSAAASAAVATRLDTSRLVLPKLEASGELAKASEREIGEQISQAQRVAIVAGVAKGLLGVPLLVLLGAVALSFVGWLVGGKGRFVESFSVAALATIPSAVGNAVLLVAALRQDTLSPALAKSLVPSSLVNIVGEQTVRGWAPSGVKADAFISLIGMVDLFQLWSALVVGVGFVAFSRIRPALGFPVGALAYVLAVAAVTVGLPGLAPPGGGR